MPRWSKVKRGDAVVLKGATFEVVKIKAKGKHAKVTVRGAAGTFESKVPLDGKVERAPLYDGNGAMTRWAGKGEVKRRDPIPAGNPKVTKPPAKPSGDPWETSRDKTERLLERALGAVLIGEATDEGAGYYVPLPDVSNIAGHLLTFHGADPSAYGDEGAMLADHAAMHAEAAGGSPLKVNHWHTKTRPEVKA